MIQNDQERRQYVNQSPPKRQTSYPTLPRQCPFKFWECIDSKYKSVDRSMVILANVDMINFVCSVFKLFASLLLSEMKSSGTRSRPHSRPPWFLLRLKRNFFLDRSRNCAMHFYDEDTDCIESIIMTLILKAFATRTKVGSPVIRTAMTSTSTSLTLLLSILFIVLRVTQYSVHSRESTPAQCGFHLRRDFGT